MLGVRLYWGVLGRLGAILGDPSLLEHQSCAHFSLGCAAADPKQRCAGGREGDDDEDEEAGEQ